MKTSALLLLAFITGWLSPVLAQGDSDWFSKTYELDDFRDINLKGGFRVYLLQGSKASLEIRASEAEALENILVRNNGSSLDLKVERRHFDFSRVNLYITFKSLENLIISGGVTLKTHGYLDLNDLYVKVEGGSKIDLDIKADDVRLVGEGGMLFNISGVAQSLDVKISGAAHVDASDLKTRDVVFKIEGLGTGSVYATESLFTDVEGVGKIKYKGNPKVTKNIGGLGSVTRQ